MSYKYVLIDWEDYQRLIANSQQESNSTHKVYFHDSITGLTASENRQEVEKIKEQNDPLPTQQEQVIEEERFDTDAQYGPNTWESSFEQELEQKDNSWFDIWQTVKFS